METQIYIHTVYTVCQFYPLTVLRKEPLIGSECIEHWQHYGWSIHQWQRSEEREASLSTSSVSCLHSWVKREVVFHRQIFSRGTGSRLNLTDVWTQSQNQKFSLVKHQAIPKVHDNKSWGEKDKSICTLHHLISFHDKHDKHVIL